MFYFLINVILIFFLMIGQNGGKPALTRPARAKGQLYFNSFPFRLNKCKPKGTYDNFTSSHTHAHVYIYIYMHMRINRAAKFVQRKHDLGA